MTAEAYHDWGCGALNNTRPCCCGEGWTVETIERDAARQARSAQAMERQNEQKGKAFTIEQSLRRLDKIAHGLKNQ